NTTTLFTFLINRVDADTAETFVRAFRMRLGFALVDAADLLPWRQAPLVFTKGNPRSVVGAMNDMKRLLAPHPDARPEDRVEDDEDFLNHTPFRPLGMGTPQQVFAEKLREALRA